MAQTSPATELRKLSVDDLRREITALRAAIGKKRIDLHLQKEKNSGAYRAEKRQLARLLTILNEKTTEQLPSAAKSSRLSARAAKNGASSSTQS